MGTAPMKSPFQMISDAFQPRYRVNFSIEKPDGSILLTLSDGQGTAVKRYIAPDQWRDEGKLRRLIASLSLTLAIERDDEMPVFAPVAEQFRSREQATL